MLYYQHQNVNGYSISVTSSASYLYDLINTAASTTDVRAGFPSDANAVDITPEDGEVRVVFSDSIDPTTALGQKLAAGSTYRFRGVPLTKMKLIRVGGSNVACTVVVGKSTAEESTSADLTPGTAASGAISVSLDDLLSGEDENRGVFKVERQLTPTRINSNTTTTIHSGACYLGSITINTSGASSNTITIYDNTAGSGTVVAVIDGTASPQTLTYDVLLSTGLTIVTATGTAADITVSSAE